MRAGWSRIAAVVALTAALGTAACSSSGESDELLVYSAQHESLTKEWIEAFTAETGIPVTYRQGGDTEMGNQLVAEGDASPADVFLTENSPAMAAVERAGLFADISPEVVAQVPAQCRPASNKWTGVAATRKIATNIRASGLTYRHLEPIYVLQKKSHYRSAAVRHI